MLDEPFKYILELSEQADSYRVALRESDSSLGSSLPRSRDLDERMEFAYADIADMPPRMISWLLEGDSSKCVSFILYGQYIENNTKQYK